MNAIRIFLLAGAATLCLSAVAAAAPKVSLSASVGPPTSKTTVSLSGFAASKAVDVYFDTTDLCLVITSTKGTGSCTIRIPANAQPATHWVSAVEHMSGTGARSQYAVAVNWPQYHSLNGSNDGFNRYENTISIQNAGLLELLWTAVPTVEFWGSPVISSGRVFAAGHDSRLYGFNARTGASLPGFPKLLTGGVDYQSPVISGVNVYVSTQGPGAQLSAFNIATGAPLAGFPKAIGEGSAGGPTVVGNNIYVADSSGKIHGFKALTGALLPNFPITVAGNPYFFTPITYLNGRLYVGARYNKLYVFDAVAGGAPVTSIDASGTIDFGGPAASGGTIYIKPYGANHMSRYTADLALIWDSPVTSMSHTDGTPAVANGEAIISDSQGWVFALDVAKGGLRWTRQLDGSAWGSPIIANGVVFAGSGAAIYALNAATGELLWSHAGGIAFGQSPAVANGIVYAVSNTTGGLRAFSINGQIPGMGRPGTAPPAFTALKPDPSLKPQP